MTEGVLLRPVQTNDFLEFFEHQRDAAASRMAAFPARPMEVHMAHWRNVTADPEVMARTICHEEKVVGHIVSWKGQGTWQVGYWIGRDFWGKGFATEALRQFLAVQTQRPLYAHVAVHNVGSIRVLEKCGFREWGREKAVSINGGEPVDEVIFMM
jgi:RimJ/RimL family protein N-acetyltransferase